MKHIELKESSMKFFGQTLAVLFSLALLGVLGVGGYSALKVIIDLFQRMDFQVAMVTAIASVVALFAARIIASSLHQVSTQHKLDQLHAEKAATYLRFLDLWTSLLQHGRDSGDHSSDTRSEELLALERLLMLYGSSSVVKAYVALRTLERDSGFLHPQVRLQVAKVLLEIRQDLGMGTRRLTVEELLSLLRADAAKTSAPVNVSAYHDLTPRVSLVSRS
jgi:hypothetical protein